MSECLVTKLKGTVNDDSLLKLGELRITNNPDAGGTLNEIVLTSNEQQIVSIVSGTMSASSGGASVSSITLEANVATTIYFSSEETSVISIPNKYALTSIGGVNNRDSINYGFKLEDVKYCTNLTGLCDGYSGSGDLSDLPEMKNVLILNLLGSGYTGDISYIGERVTLRSEGQRLLLLNAPNLTGDVSSLKFTENTSTANVLYIQNNKKITGNITDVIKNYPFRYITIMGTSQSKEDYSPITGDIGDISCEVINLNIYRTNIGGSIEDFVAAQRAGGQTTGSVSSAWWGSNNCTFKGSAFSFIGTNNPLTWTESQITFNGETIDA